jgi:hypothetical protein
MDLQDGVAENFAQSQQAAEKRQGMLRRAQHERKFLNDYKPLSVRPFDRLRAGSEPVEGLFKGFSVSC